jgi:signal transduction histidine kinase/ActR/RegA family two-component response regulator
MPEKQKYFTVTAKSLEMEQEVGGWVLVLRDVTEENERQQYILSQERLAVVGQMAAGIAHDFNNILAVIELYAQLMLYTSTLSPKNRERLDIINQQSQRAASLIRQILDFSRRSLLEMKQIRLLPYLTELINLLERAFPENIAIQFIDKDSDLEVNADPARLQEALMNLALNARDAMPDGGSLNITLSRIEIEIGEKPPLPDMVPGEWARLQVEDSGTGIDPAHLDHMFEPFFTTKPPGQGTGLGLAQVYGIVRQHQGNIDVNSEVDRGTAFTIYLPAVIPKLQKSEQEEFAPVKGAGEKILVVEDEAATREAISEVLEMLGYQVIIAKDGFEAQKHCLSSNGQIRLVISDLIMPGMSGEELHSWLQEQKPLVNMVAITGYPLEEGGKSLLEKGIVAWIQKPFTADSLANAVADALAEPASRDKEPTALNS